MLIFRYLSREVLTTMLAVTFLVLLIIMSGRFIQVLDRAATGDIASDVLFQVIFYRMPNFLNLILPMGFFIGILLAHGRLYVESEMVVLSTSGMSPTRLLYYTGIPAVFLVAFMALNGIYLAPTGEAKVAQIMSDPKTRESLAVLIPGEFQSFNRNKQTVYVEELTDDKKRMKTVFLSSVDERANLQAFPKVRLVIADTARIVVPDSGGESYLELYDGFNYQGAPGSNDYQIAQFATYGVKMSDRRGPEVRRERRDAVPTSRLFGSDNPDYQATLQWRLSLPLIIPVVTLLALSMSRTNPRQGRYAKLFPAIVLYMLYLVSLNGARGAIESESLSPAVGLWPVHGAFFLLGLGLFYGPYLMFRYGPRQGDRQADGGAP